MELGWIVGDDDGGASRGVGPGDQGVDEVLGVGIETGEGLVEQEEPRPGDQQTGNLDPTQHPERARLALTVARIVEAHHPQGGVDSPRVLAGEAYRVLQVLPQAQLADDRGDVAQEPDVVAYRVHLRGAELRIEHPPRP